MTAPSTRPAAIFAPITRIRRGTSVNVISAVRCDHSELTSRMPTIGSRMLAGVIASANMSRKISSSVSPKMHNAARRRERQDRDDQLQPEAGAGVDHLAQLDERSAAGTRRSCGHLGEIEEELFEAGALGRAEVGQDHGAAQRGGADGLGLGVDDERAVDLR